MSARGASVESFAHIEAKRLLLAWLRRAAAMSGNNSHCEPWPAEFGDGLSWRVNRGKPHFGIWPEYPVLSDGTGIEPVWDEVSDLWKDRPPTFDEVIESGYKPMAVLDIAIQHKGRIAYAIEVVHKHRCQPRKVAFLRPHLTLLEIPAYWVLGQVKTPTAIPSEFFI